MAGTFFILLILSIGAFMIGRRLEEEEKRREAVRRAAQTIKAGRSALFNAVHSDPQFDRPVLVWRCQRCDRLVFVPQRCPRCHSPAATGEPFLWAREADVITQRGVRP